MSTPTSETLDCRTCGACCAGWEIDLTPEDVQVVPAQLVKDGLTGPRMRERLGPPGPGRKASGCGRCVALRGKIGESVTCSIYSRRPVVCQEFEPGNYDCHRAREREGLGGAQALKQMDAERELRAFGLELVERDSR